MGIILGDNGTLQSISYGGGMIGEWGESKLLKSFTYTGSDQVYTIPEDGKYTFKVKGAGSNNAKGGYAEGTFTLTKGDKISVMVGQNGGSTSSATYGFGGSGNYGSDRAGGGLSGVFTGSTSITASDSTRAMIIAGGAGGGKASGGAGGGETGGNGTKGSYGTAGGGGTQTGRNSGGNTGANQFNGGNGSGTYGSGGGGGWYGGNSSVGDSSGDDDSGSGGGSGYVLSTAEGRVLTQGGGADAKSNGSIEMYQSVKVYKGNVQKVMLGETQVRPERGGREPGPNTIAYYPLTSSTTVNDKSGNNHKLTNVGSTTFGINEGVDCAKFSGSNYLYCSPFESVPFTVSFYVYIQTSSWDSVEKGLVRHTWGTYNGWHSTIINSSDVPYTKNIRIGTDPGNNSTYGLSTPNYGWHNIILVCDNTNMTYYFDGVKQGNNSKKAVTGSQGYFTIGTEYRSSFSNHFKGFISEVIVENKVRTASEIADYYANSKGNYGL